MCRTLEAEKHEDTMLKRDFKEREKQDIGQTEKQRRTVCRRV